MSVVNTMLEKNTYSHGGSEKDSLTQTGGEKKVTKKMKLHIPSSQIRESAFITLCSDDLLVCHLP